MGTCLSIFLWRSEKNIDGDKKKQMSIKYKEI